MNAVSCDCSIFFHIFFSIGYDVNSKIFKYWLSKNRIHIPKTLELMFTEVYGIYPLTHSITLL